MLPCDPGAHRLCEPFFTISIFAWSREEIYVQIILDDKSRFKKKYRDANFNAALTFSRPKFEHVFRRNLFCSTINSDQSGKLNDFRISDATSFLRKKIYNK